jgi:hypothetical protein
MAVIFGTILMFLWYSAPRLIRDVVHARDYVPAQSLRVTDYKGTNWNAPGSDSDLNLCACRRCAS